MSQRAGESTPESERVRAATRLVPDSHAPADGAPAPRKTGLLVTFILGALAAVPPLSMDMYLPALPEVTRGLDSSASTIQVTLTTCLTGMALGQIVVGPMSDRLGRRRPLLIGLVAYVFATAICALAPTAEVLIAFRLLQGVTIAAGIVIARAVVRDMYDGLEMARFFSTLLLVSSLAPIIAPIIGGQVLRVTDWRGIFVVLTVIGAALTLLVWRRLPETLVPERRQTGGVRAALWVMRGLFADRVFTGYVLTNGFIFGTLFAYIAASPFVIQEVYGASPQTFSLIFAINALGLLIVGQINGKILVGRVRLERALGLGLVVVVLAGVALLMMAGGVFGTVGLVPIAVGLFVLTPALGLILPNTNALALMRSPHAAGSASALLGTSCYAVGAIASLLVGVGGKSSAAPMTAVQLGSAVAALVCFAALCRPWRDLTPQKAGH
ncbi:multidrug effflux MFS transporter (plasmid) [Streptomyces sp. NBC_01298]|uniref:multidrug effflux MFS transporter n=1 Tax=Streptomyces sp. NBC_01298 TaxID=2903817 RepID=UPI002E0D5125|nr:multidrug effflux MFS transporter [Streptomyces sp. NBC_01298]